MDLLIQNLAPLAPNLRPVTTVYVGWLAVNYAEILNLYSALLLAFEPLYFRFQIELRVVMCANQVNVCFMQVVEVRAQLLW